MSATGTTILDQLRARAQKLYASGNYTEAAVAYRGIMEVVPSDFDALHHLGLVAFELGHLEEARKLLQGALNMRPDDAEIWLHHGMTLQRQGRADDAVVSYEHALSLKPDYSEAMFCIALTQKNAGRAPEALASFGRFIAMRGDVSTAFLHRGDLLRDTGDVPAALADYESALNLNPEFLDAWMHRGVLLTEHGRSQEALASYDRALAVAPRRGDIWYNRGVALQDMGRDPEALEAYDQSLKFTPEFADAWNNRGALLRKAGRIEDALASFQQALQLRPDLLQGLNNAGAALAALNRNEEALPYCDKAVAVAPDQAEGWYNRGVALQGLGRAIEATAAYDRAIELDPNAADAWSARGNILREQRKFDEALSCYQRALAINPRHAGALANSGACLQEMKRFAEAMREFRKLEMVAPDHKYLLGGLAISALALCDWAVLEEIGPRLRAGAMNGASIVPPFTMLGISADPALLRATAEHYARDAGMAPPLPRPQFAAHERIRLGYVSSDFHAHATARLMSDLFERHDRARFEVIAISSGPDETSPVRARLKQAFDQFHDVRGQSQAQIAGLMKGLGLDIAIDLKGYTEGGNPALFKARPAPVQVNYLGYPGTTAIDAIDYIIGDSVVLPFDQQVFYSERIVQLPHAYQANDPKRAIGPTPSRAEAGLPEQGFVFCCFNNHWKITAAVFDVWMRLLEAVPDSVLWLLEDSAAINLRRQAQARGIAAERVIFAPRLAHDAHLGRLGLADLVLDTLPYNAHTTASDALWTGVPMVTVRGEAFAGRVGASLLTAIGLPELIADDLEGYEKLALSLATDAKKLKTVKARLEKNRLSTPLFDAEAFCRHIEAAFIAMVDAARRGEAPKSFAVPE